MKKKPHRRDEISDDLKQFIALCRSGHLFEVQRWIAGGKRFQMPEGKFYTWPLRVAIDSGSHSLVEVLLRAGVSETEKMAGLRQAIKRRRSDLVDLLAGHGAEASRIGFDELMRSGQPDVFRWFIDRGMDMDKGWPIAKALRERHREFLGIYMELRDKVPSARMQAAMALRVHAAEGNLKWVSLLLWAGADPRLAVPNLNHPDEEELASTALEDAIAAGRVEVIKKIGIDPARDNPTHLLRGCLMNTSSELVNHLLDAGADPNGRVDEGSPMQSLFTSFEWCIEMETLNPRAEDAMQAIETLAKAGGRWRPADSYRRRCFRTALAKAYPWESIGWLCRLMDAGAIEQPVFADLMDTPKMRAILASPSHGVAKLRELARPATKGTRGTAKAR